ncbi:glutaredoxin family protein [Psychrobacillus sp. MER TA 171]|uniref:glutaredoxin family protein n=1 Tax=Psychrobacillus sp. MER TA 171 TaxID=2939577 RepID=UPI00203A3A89|nr:glutaredoxin family protein [Psychrobacillus sp. MER TA 171]MCM3358149.1 glutaredoxin family protein [Psychrobacillus sp. MER TA 171]
MKNNIVLYGNDECSFCREAKGWLTEKNMPFTMKDTKELSNFNEFKGYNSPGIPLLIITDENAQTEKKIIGFSKEKYTKEFI